MVTGAASLAPVLVELFTSEGCSMPPRIACSIVSTRKPSFLASTSTTGTTRSGRTVLGRHLQPTAGKRTAAGLALESVDTPEMVVDGETEFNGTDKQWRAPAKISRADQQPKAEVRISRRRHESQGGEVGAPPASAGIFLILAQEDSREPSDAYGGENNGRRLHHVAIVQSIPKIGSVKRGHREVGFQPRCPAPDASWSSCRSPISALFSERA